MCGRYFVKIDDEFTELYQQALERNNLPKQEILDFDVHPSEKALALGKGKQGIKPGFLNWGFPVMDKEIINSRLETVDEKISFKKAFQQYRCVLVASGFYEWDSNKNMYVITADTNLIYLAGIYSLANKGFSILTKESYGDLAKIHPRTPIMLTKQQAYAYCENKLNKDQLQMLQPKQTLQLFKNV